MRICAVCIIQLHGGRAEHLQYFFFFFFFSGVYGQVWSDTDEVSLKMDKACIKL
jgi:hypothetical protein